MLFCDCVQGYFRTYLMQQRGYGEHTLASYRDTFKLLVEYLSSSDLGVDALEMADVGKEAVTGFLCWLESARGNIASTRNVRLAHLKSFASYVMMTSP
ncbi:MAG: site-specific integrase, partial [Coriobacteriaceae bacterium]|nr:site-specific integrase [Coriobacteriaceae bacterium]